MRDGDGTGAAIKYAGHGRLGEVKAPVELTCLSAFQLVLEKH